MAESMRLEDYSDREFLATLRDVLDGNGQASTQDVVDRVGLTSKRPRSNVGVRLGYMKRIGLVARDDETHRWFLTPVGERFVAGRLTKAQENAIAALNEGSAWLATGQLASLLRDAGDQQATLMRRQWQHGWLQRNH